MWLDALALLVLGIFVGVGMLRGALASGLALFSLIAAYTAGVVAAPRLGPPLAGVLGLPELLGAPLAGALAFASAYLAMGVLSLGLRGRERRRRAGVRRSPRDRFLGGIFGALRGGIVVLLLAWLALWLDALRLVASVETVPEVDGSRAAAIAESVIEAGASRALADAGPAGQLAARVAARPGAAVRDLQAVLESPQIETLRGDRLFWTYVESGAVDAALHRSSFLAVAYDASLRQELANLGVIDERAADDPTVFRAAVAEVLREVGPRLRGLREDPELQALVADPQFAAMVQSGDTWGLVTDPRFRELVARVASDSE